MTTTTGRLLYNVAVALFVAQLRPETRAEYRLVLSVASGISALTGTVIMTERPALNANGPHVQQTHSS